MNRRDCGTIVFTLVFVVCAACAFGQATQPGMDESATSLASMRTYLENRLHVDCPDSYRAESRALSNLVANLSESDRPGWASSQIVSWANRHPETNAVLVSGWDPARRRPIMSWQTRYSDEEVSEGRRKNQVSRFIVLLHCLDSIRENSRGVPMSELLLAFNGLWAEDMLDRAWGRGFNSMQFHRKMDGMSSPRWFYELVSSSPGLDPEIRVYALSCLVKLSSSVEEQNRFKKAIERISLSSDQFPRISGFGETNVTERMRAKLSFDHSRAEIPSLRLLDERGNAAVSALLAETATMLDSPEGTNAVQNLIRLISPYESPDMRGFRPMECEMQIRCFIETNKFGNAAYLGNVLARLDRFSPEVQRDIFYTFSDLLIDPFPFDSDSEERKEATIREFSLDIIPLLWSIARNANVSAEVRRWAWIHVGAAVQRGDPSAAPFAAGLKAADEAIAEAERETERERRLRTEAPPPTPPRTNAEPILVGVKVRRNRNPSSTTNAPPGFPAP